MKPNATEATYSLVEDIFNDKKYCEITLPNKDIEVIVWYNHNSRVHLRYCYNSISQTYMGLQCLTFISELRGLLRVCPDFFEQVSEQDYRKNLKALGFENIEPSDADIKLYNLINNFYEP